MSFQPTDIAGCQLWLDASDASTFTFGSGTAVSQWNDKSGNTNHVSQSTAGQQPTRSGTINGLSSIVFDGSDDILERPNFQLANATTGVWTAFAVFVHAGSGGNNPASVVDCDSNNRVAQALRVNSGSLESIAFATPVAAYTDAMPTVADNVTCIASSVRGLTTVEAWLNGVSNGSTSTLGINATASSRLMLGGNDTFNNQWMAGQLGEVITYNSALSSTDRATVESYLITKWSGPPLTVAGCVAWFDANDSLSFTFGTGSLVSQWNDKSGHGRNLGQSNSSIQPSRSSTVNGLPSVLFTNSLATALIYDEGAQTLDLSSGFTFFAVANYMSSAGYTRIFAGMHDTANADYQGSNVIFTNQIGGTGNFGAVSSGTSSNNVNSVPTAAAAIFSSYHDGTNLNMGLNGVYVTAVACSPPAALQYLHMGIEVDSGAFPQYSSGGAWNGSISEVLVYTGKLSSGDMATISTYLTNKWLVAPTTIIPMILARYRRPVPYLVRRGRQRPVVRAQVNPPFPLRSTSQARHGRFLAFVRRRPGPVFMRWAQATPPYRRNAQRPATRRLVRPTRRPSATVIPPQLNPPFQRNVINQTPGRRRVLIQRKRPNPAFPTTPQTAAPLNYPPSIQRRRIPPVYLARGRSTPTSPAIRYSADIVAQMRPRRAAVFHSRRQSPAVVPAQYDVLNQRVGRIRPLTSRHSAGIALVVPAQVNPPYQRNAINQPGKRITFLKRRLLTIAVPPQMNPPYQRNVIGQPGRHTPSVKRRSMTVVIPQQIILASGYQVGVLDRPARRAALLRRRSLITPVPSQASPPFQRSQVGRRASFLKRRSLNTPTSAQLNPPFQRNAMKQSTRRVLTLQAKRRAPTPTSLQVLPPYRIASPRRSVVARRRTAVRVIASQIAPPPQFVPAQRRSTRRYIFGNPRARRPLFVFEHGVWRLHTWNGASWISHPVREYDPASGTWVLATNAKAFDPSNVIWVGLNPNA